MDVTSRRFLWLYAKSQLKLKYRDTYLGFAWNFVEPALYLGMLSVIFSAVNRMNIHDYTVFLFGALIPWRYFESAVSGATESIVGGGWLLKKMYVSPLVFPLIRWLVASLEFLFSFTVVLLLLIFMKDHWTVHLCILPLSIVPWAMLSLGVGLICAVFFSFFRDVRPIVNMVMMFTFFSSPILFKIDFFDSHTLQAFLLKFHPMTYFAFLFQKPIYYASWPSMRDWGITFGISAAVVIIGCYLVHKFQGRYYFYL